MSYFPDGKSQVFTVESTEQLINQRPSDEIACIEYLTHKYRKLHI